MGECGQCSSNSLYFEEVETVDCGTRVLSVVDNMNSSPETYPNNVIARISHTEELGNVTSELVLSPSRSPLRSYHIVPIPRDKSNITCWYMSRFEGLCSVMMALLRIL